MAQRIASWPWDGQEYNAPLSNGVTVALGGAIRRATAEAATHPGLYQARSDDIVSPQEWVRPALVIPPSELDQWNAILRTNIDGGRSNGG